MMQQVRKLLGIPFVILQWVVGMVGWWGLRAPSRWFHRLNDLWGRYVYYRGVVRPKRWVTGEDAFQVHDIQLGIMPPPDWEPPGGFLQVTPENDVLMQRYERCAKAFDNVDIVRVARAVLDNEIYDSSPELREIAGTWLDARDNHLALRPVDIAEPSEVAAS